MKYKAQRMQRQNRTTTAHKKENMRGTQLNTRCQKNLNHCNLFLVAVTVKFLDT